MNDQTPENNDQHDPFESPTFPIERQPKHAFTFQPVNIEISEPKQEPEKKSKSSKGKKKTKSPHSKKKATVKEVDSHTPKEGKEKKKKLKPKDKKGGDTPKFIEKKQMTFSDIIKDGADEEINLNPDAILLSLPKNENYKEDIMIGLNIISYLRSKHVSKGNKVFYSFIILLFISNCIINLCDLVLYATTSCPDHYSGVAMYFNFLVLVFAKIGIFNYITSEMNASLSYDLKFPFIIPILSVGVIANFQLPLIVYDYYHCNARSHLLQLNFGYFVIDIVAAVVALGFIAMVLSMIFFQKLRVTTELIKFTRTILYFLGISVMILLNALFLIVSFSQTAHFSMTLLLENLTYWTLVISGALIFILKKRFNVVVFKPLPEIDEEQMLNPKHVKPPAKSAKIGVIIPNRVPPIEVTAVTQPSPEVPLALTSRRTSVLTRKSLEKIEENDYENETDNSPTTMVGQEDITVSNFAIKHMRVPSVDPVNLSQDIPVKERGI